MKFVCLQSFGKNRIKSPAGIFQFLAVLLLAAPALLAQTPAWRSEADSILQVASATQAVSRTLANSVERWRKTVESGESGKLPAAQQAEWASNMARLNQNYQQLLVFSDRYETARKYSTKEFARWSAISAEAGASLEQLRLLTVLLEIDRTLYGVIDSLQHAAGSSPTIKNRLNEGNRSFGLQYGIFEEMTATYFDPARRRKTRGHYLQVQSKKNALTDELKAKNPELLHFANGLLNDPTLQEIATQSDVSALVDNSVAALGNILDPALDLSARTVHNFSQFFGNFIGTNLFRIADFFGIGESRGHTSPDFPKYYPHPGDKNHVHPEMARILEERLLPGDLLFEKARFTITDKLIPGYLGHVAIYLQSYEALHALGVFATEELRQATHGMSAAEIDEEVEAYAVEIAGIVEKEDWMRLAIMRRRVAQKTHNGRPLPVLLFEALYRLKYRHENVLEALRNGQTIAAHEGGVTLNPFEHFLYVDDFVATRLKQGELDSVSHRQNLARFLALGLLQYGKPYDFRFDVNTLDAIVCSELIYQSFVDIDFSTATSLTSYTISPDQVAQTAGIATKFDTLKIRPAFALGQWYFQAMPLYPTSLIEAKDGNGTGALEEKKHASDSLATRTFMAMVREEQGGLKLLRPDEHQQFDSLQAKAKAARAKESERLQKLPAARSLAVEAPPDRAGDRGLQNLFINLQKEITLARKSGKPAEGIQAIEQEALQKHAMTQQDSSASDLSERTRALSEVFHRWQTGAAFRPNYDELYSGGERFFLGVFRSAGVADDDGFGRGVDLQLSGNNEAPRRFALGTQLYSFLPFAIQIYDNSGRIHQTLQGGAALATISRRYLQGDQIDMTALLWRNTAYATQFSLFELEASGDKGPLAAMLKLMTLGNGRYQRGLYVGESGRVELAPYETRNHRRAFTIANLFYGIKAQLTVGKFRLYANGAVGERVGEFGERKSSGVAIDFPSMRVWSVGLELFSSSLYRPTSHHLQFEVLEDDARFIGGQLQTDRQARLSYRWSLSD